MTGAYEWSYLARGKVTHARSRYSSGLAIVAICGASPAHWDPVGWRGTGNQDEYDNARDLPKCKRCLRVGHLCYCHPGCSACEIGEPCPHGQVPR